MSSEECDEDEYIREVREMTAEVIDALSDLRDTEQRVQVLISTIGFILCNSIKTEREARMASSRISHIIERILSFAHSRGDTIWHDGPWH